MITQRELIEALTGIGLDVDVQISLDGIPLDIDKVSLDERRGVIFLRPHPETVPDALRRFIAVVTTGHSTGRQECTVRRNAYGHYELLTK